MGRYQNAKKTSRYSDDFQHYLDPVKFWGWVPINIEIQAEVGIAPNSAWKKEAA